MANIANQFYYAHGGRPILKTEYDDGSEDFYDASGQFNGYSFSHLSDGTVFDPYADLAQQEATRQQQAQQINPPVFSDGTGRFSVPNSFYANPGGSQMPTPFSRNQNTTPARDDWSNPAANAINPGQRTSTGLPLPGQSVQSPTQATPSTPGQVPSDPRLAQDMTRYDWAGNPRQALLNALADLGGYQLVNNPFVDRLVSAAPALATSFMSQRGLAGATSADQSSSYGDFGRFLQDALRSGSVFSTVNTTQGMFPRVVDAVRQFNQQASANPNGGGIADNPFIRQLAAMFASNNNQGALGLYGQLFSPFLTGAQQRPFSDLMESRYTMGARDFYRGGNPATPGYGGNDCWKYLFGY